MRIPNPPKQIESFAVAIFEVLWLMVRVIAVIVLTSVRTFSHTQNHVRAKITGYSKQSYLNSYKPIREQNND